MKLANSYFSQSLWVVIVCLLPMIGLNSEASSSVKVPIELSQMTSRSYSALPMNSPSLRMEASAHSCLPLNQISGQVSGVTRTGLFFSPEFRVSSLRQNALFFVALGYSELKTARTVSLGGADQNYFDQLSWMSLKGGYEVPFSNKYRASMAIQPYFSMSREAETFTAANLAARRFFVHGEFEWAAGVEAVTSLKHTDFGVSLSFGWGV